MSRKDTDAKYSRTFKGRYRRLKTNSKSKGQPTDITFSEYVDLITKPCFYCWGKLDSAGVGLDRLDSDRGYIYENVITCCGECNRIKSNIYEADQMIKIAQVLRMLKWGNGP